MYHVMNRGDQREAIFRDDEDRQRFLATLGEACQKTEWQVHAYCLMNNHYGAERQETGVQKAERIVGEELGRLSWSEEELCGRPKGHPGKVVIARRLRQETIMSLSWIAHRLGMGTWTYVSNLLNARAVASPGQEVLPLCQ